MFGTKALELVKEFHSSKTGALQPYNEDVARRVFEEMRALYEQNQEEVNKAVNSEDHDHLFAGIALRHTANERNQRCVMAYIFNRLNVIKKMRWEFGSVLPPDIKVNLCEAEIQWFSKYNKSLAKYMRSIGEYGGLDLTQDIKPPKSLYIEVRCLVDHGEFETQDGSNILLKKNSQHFLVRTECENLIRQGILEHVVH